MTASKCAALVSWPSDAVGASAPKLPYRHAVGVGLRFRGSASAIKAGWDYMGNNNKQRANKMASAVDSIDSTLPLNQALAGDKLLQRDCFAEFKATVNLTRADDQNPSLLVYGARGGGKTSIVEAALQGIAGVLAMSYNGDGTDLEQRLEQLLLKPAGLPGHGPKADLGDRLRAILTFYQKVYDRRPVVVIHIDERTAPATLSKLLLAAEQLGFQEKLATFIFVVSAYRSALGLPIGLSQTQVLGYRAPDFTEDEALAYLAKHLPSCPGMAEFAVQQIGTRAMDLVELCSACRGVESETECRARVAALRAMRIGDARFALRGFVGIAKKNKAFEEKAGLAFFEKLLAAHGGDAALARACVLDDDVLTDYHAAVAFGFEKPALLLSALAEYHAFVVDPFYHTISMQSHCMRIAIQEYLQAVASSAASAHAPSHDHRWQRQQAPPLSSPLNPSSELRGRTQDAHRQPNGSGYNIFGTPGAAQQRPPARPAHGSVNLGAPSYLLATATTDPSVIPVSMPPRWRTGN
ncbi:hypothetical protein JKP88DRAFT_242459 [Tribonema minus]|uniref:Uncharacterized protein n=1 Tax=Tribonema minus TaxID=303371 RepID=A0A835YHU7_9STRA|nr:hypothetical protein JKP88DRAFT_242459 [Tribonema minus]